MKSLSLDQKINARYALRFHQKYKRKELARMTTKFLMFFFPMVRGYRIHFADAYKLLYTKTKNRRAEKND